MQKCVCSLRHLSQFAISKLAKDYSEEEKDLKKGKQKLIASVLIAGLPVGLILWFMPTQKALGVGIAILLLLGVLSSKRNY